MICNFCRKCEDREIPQNWLNHYCSRGGHIDDVELTSVYAFQCIDDHKIVADIEFLCKTFNTTSLEEACMKALGIHDTR
jgi:hypothetical protein